MNFKQFLNESVSDGNYKTKIDLEEAAKTFIKECDNIDINKPLWRGMRGSEPSFILKGNASRRGSISNLSAHNRILDELIEDTYGRKYPLRSASIVGITNGGKGYTTHFGSDRYAIYPFNNTIIGVCKHKDILETEYKGFTISYINELIYEITGINDPDSISELIQSIYKAVEYGETDCDDEEYLEHFGKLFEGHDREGISQILDDIYGLDNYEFVKNNSNELSGSKEVWIGDKCIAIHEKHLNEFIKIVKEK